MFTGIVEEVGTVKAVSPTRLTVAARKVLDDTRLGDSIAVNGVCLTATELSSDLFAVEVMPETLRRTNLGSLKVGARVNLERPLAVGGRFGGHFVQGHVDGTGTVVSAKAEGDAILLKFDAPPQITRYIVEKGFIAVDGASLTVVECSPTAFSVSLVGYTQSSTTLGGAKPSDVVNLEVDIIAKYAERLGEGRSNITAEFLAEHGFL